MDWALGGLIFLMLMLRACAFGAQYWYQLDDYIQYHNYAAGNDFCSLVEAVGLLASRPLAGIADYFVWSPLFDHMIVGVAIVSALYAVSAVLMKRLISRYFALSPLFLLVMAMLPLGVEGTYWMSASTRIVVGLLFACLTGWSFAWWLDRAGFQFTLFDTLRIDHFRGFDAYYAIPYGDKTARNGRWMPGPGIDFFRALNRALGRRDIIAEDLGFLTPSVKKLLRQTGYPGMKVLQFAFDSRDTGSDYLPHCYTHNCVVYTGTHDNDTILGWMASAPRKDVAFAREYLRLSRREGYHWGMMRAAWASPADLAVMQMQDLLGLGGEARMNIPSTLGSNWMWRCLPGSFTPALARRLRREMKVYQRLPRGRGRK